VHRDAVVRPKPDCFELVGTYPPFLNPPNGEFGVTTRYPFIQTIPARTDWANRFAFAFARLTPKSEKLASVVGRL
jgi:hypothetical protein